VGASWVADISYLRCWEGLVFFGFVLDSYSRMVVGCQFAGHMRTAWGALNRSRFSETAILRDDRVSEPQGRSQTVSTVKKS
jgi:transposase InsO family protein